MMYVPFAMRLDRDTCSEYALVDEEYQIITYVYLKFMLINDIELDQGRLWIANNDLSFYANVGIIIL